VKKAVPILGLAAIMFGAVDGCSHNSLKSPPASQITVALKPKLPDITISLPKPDGTSAAILDAVQKAGSQFTGYKMGTTPQVVKTPNISVDVVNIMDSFTTGSGGVIMLQSLKPADRDKTSQAISDGVKRFLQARIPIADNSAYRMLVVIYGGDSVYLDGNQRPWGMMSVRLVLLDGKTRQVLWYTEKARGQGKDLPLTTQSAVSSIAERLGVLFGDRKENKSLSSGKD
jgi:hypothetical protein